MLAQKTLALFGETVTLRKYQHQLRINLDEDSIPGPQILKLMTSIWSSWPEQARSAFADEVCHHEWTLMLELNSTSHEHVFPIKEDFLEFVAVLDRDGMPVPQADAFAFFDRHQLRHVHCEAKIPISELATRLLVERSATDREGAVLYLEDEGSGLPVALVKVKSDFYVKARRTRQIFWNTIVHPALRSEQLGDEGKTTGWAVASRRILAGFRELTHVEGCSDHWQKWADEALGFLKWWRSRYESAPSEQKIAVAREAKLRFGTLYRDYCRDAALPGGDN